LKAKVLIESKNMDRKQKYELKGKIDMESKNMD